MKKTLALLTILIGIVSTSSAFAGMRINQLRCSGLGPVNGLTVINLVDNRTVSISSTKYFVTSADDAVEIRSSQILGNGSVKLSLYSPQFDSTFALVMSSSSGPASFVTSSGTDTLKCESNISAGNDF